MTERDRPFSAVRITPFTTVTHTIGHSRCARTGGDHVAKTTDCGTEFDEASGRPRMFVARRLAEVAEAVEQRTRLYLVEERGSACRRTYCYLSPTGLTGTKHLLAACVSRTWRVRLAAAVNYRSELNGPQRCYRTAPSSSSLPRASSSVNARAMALSSGRAACASSVSS